MDYKNGSGRPSTTTVHQYKKIVKTFQAKPITTAQEVAGMHDLHVLIKFIMCQLNN